MAVRENERRRGIIPEETAKAGPEPCVHGVCRRLGRQRHIESVCPTCCHQSMRECQRRFRFARSRNILDDNERRSLRQRRGLGEDLHWARSSNVREQL